MASQICNGEDIILTQSDIAKAINSLKREKGPGPDGTVALRRNIYASLVQQCSSSWWGSLTPCLLSATFLSCLLLASSLLSQKVQIKISRTPRITEVSLFCPTLENYLETSSREDIVQWHISQPSPGRFPTRLQCNPYSLHISKLLYVRSAVIADGHAHLWI